MYGSSMKIRRFGSAENAAKHIPTVEDYLNIKINVKVQKIDGYFGAKTQIIQDVSTQIVLVRKMQNLKVSKFQNESMK